MSEYTRDDGSEDMDLEYMHLARAMQPGVRFFRIDGRPEPFFGHGAWYKDLSDAEIAAYYKDRAPSG